MRQLLIPKNKRIKEKVGETLTILVGDDPVAVAKDEVTIVRVPLGLKPVGGNPGFKFSLPSSLASRGVLLLGAFEDDGELTVMLTSLFSNLLLQEGADLLLVNSTVFDRFKQIEVTEVKAQPQTKKTKKKK